MFSIEGIYIYIPRFVVILLLNIILNHQQFVIREVFTFILLYFVIQFKVHKRLK